MPVPARPAADVKKRMLWLALLALAPVTAASIATWLWAPDILAARGIFATLTPFHALKDLAGSLIHGRLAMHDSWAPMLQALQISGGPDHDRIYQTIFFDQHVKFQYPLTSLLPLDLMNRLSLASVRALNILNAVIYFANLATVCVLAVLAFRKWRPADGSHRWMDMAVAGIALAAALVFYPLARAFNLGQIQLAIDLAFTLACIAWVREGRLLAGMFIGLACLIKPQMGLFLLWAFAWREWAVARGFLFVAVPVAALAAIRYGLANNLAYLDVLSYMSRHGEAIWPNQTVNGILNRLFDVATALQSQAHSFPAFHPMVFTGSLAAFAVSLMLIFARPILTGGRATIFDVGIAAVCLTMGAPIAWEHHYGIMLPLYVVAAISLLAQPVPARAMTAALALSFFLAAAALPVLVLFDNTPFELLENNLFFGGLLLLAVLFRQAAAQPVAASLPGAAPCLTAQKVSP